MQKQLSVRGEAEAEWLKRANVWVHDNQCGSTWAASFCCQMGNRVDREGPDHSTHAPGTQEEWHSTMHSRRSRGDQEEPAWAGTQM